MSATDSLEADLGNALFVGSSYPTISGWSIALYTAAPADDGSGGTEVSGGSYARQALNPSGSNWEKQTAQDGSGNTVFKNKVAVTFPNATSAWGTITHFGLFDQVPTLRFVGTLDESRVIASGDPGPRFAVGDLKVLIG